MYLPCIYIADWTEKSFSNLKRNEPCVHHPNIDVEIFTVYVINDI